MDDFSFYVKFAKPLVLDLPDAKDRALAALWLKKLTELDSQSRETASNNISVEYLKLLLLAMQSNRLGGIFEKPPPSGDLQEFLPSGQQKASEMVSLIKATPTSVLGEKSFGNKHPRVVISVGGDMCEYVAVQEIPNFGIHGYYAVSTEPMSEWLNRDGAIAAEPEVSCIEAKDKEKKAAAQETNNEQQAEASTVGEISRKRHEKTRHNEKSLQKIFQAQRGEIMGVETRPCWGRSRYIDRLIDESPHLVGDLDLSEADAMLYAYRDAKFRKTKKSGMQKDSTACAISSRRRNVEKRLDMPPCASIPDEDYHIQDEELSDEAGSRTCTPKKLELRMDEDAAYACYNSDDDGYVEAPGNYLDDECESELLARTDYDSWGNDAYQTDERDYRLPKSMKEQHSFHKIVTTDDPDAVDDMKRLIEDPNRREPPSRGKKKFPQRNADASAVGRATVHFDTWNPPGHSTHINH